MILKERNFLVPLKNGNADEYLSYVVVAGIKWDHTSKDIHLGHIRKAQ